MFKLISSKILPFIIRPCSTSALYITGDKAHKSFAFLMPHIDFEERLKNKDELIENVNARKLDINIKKVINRWYIFKVIEGTKTLLEESKNDLGQELKELMKDSESYKDDIERLKIQIRLLKDDIKNIKDYLYGLEESAMNLVLGLPNVLHKRTPLNDLQKYIISYGILSQRKSESHMEIAEKYDLIECFDSKFNFLKNDAALFETAVSEHFYETLIDLNFIPFSNSDFARSIVVEGCGRSFSNNNDVFTIEETDDDKTDGLHKLHLVGSASVFSFMAYFTKHTIQKPFFPLKYFTLGRKYHPKPGDSSLLQSKQYSCLEIFIATLDDDTLLDQEFDVISEKTIKLYESLGYHFKAVYVTAAELEKHESLRLSFQMFSNYLEKYVEVGHISIYDKYLSKRLLFNYSDDKDRRFPKVIAGCLLNVQKLLACALEYNDASGKELISNTLKKYVI